MEYSFFDLKSAFQCAQMEAFQLLYMKEFFLCMKLDFTDVPLREDQREYLCKVADG